MTLEAGLYAHLAADPDVSALVSDRIYPVLVPQDAALPALAYQRVSARRHPAHDGPTGLAWARIQITCVASSYDEAKSLFEAVRDSLDGSRGTMGTVEVGATFVDTDRDDWASAFESPVVRLDVVIWHREA